MKILVVEDNQILSQNICRYLASEDIWSKALFEWKNVEYELSQHNYDCLILDLWLPDIDGLTLAERIRTNGKNLPILILTARNTLGDKSEWFHAGADDYLTKPFEYEELLMRIKALVRRNMSVKSNIIYIWDYSVDIDQKKVYQNEISIQMSHLEINLFIYLLQNKWKTISKEELLEKVWWEFDAFHMSRTVDVHIGYLRKKLWKNIIETIRGQWYLIP